MAFYIVRFKECDVDLKNGVKIVEEMEDVIEEFIREYKSLFQVCIYSKDDISMLRNLVSLCYSSKWGEKLSLFLFGTISEELAEQIQKDIHILHIHNLEKT